MAPTKNSSPDSSDAARLLAKGFRFLRFPNRSKANSAPSTARACARGIASPSACPPAPWSASRSSITSCSPPSMRASRTSCASACTCPRCIIMLICTSKRFYDRWYDLGIGFVAPLFGIGTVIMAAFSPPQRSAAGRRPPAAGVVLLLFHDRPALPRGAARQSHRVRARWSSRSLAGTMPTATATYLMFTLFTANLIGCRRLVRAGTRESHRVPRASPAHGSRDARRPDHAAQSRGVRRPDPPRVAAGAARSPDGLGHHDRHRLLQGLQRSLRPRRRRRLPAPRFAARCATPRGAGRSISSRVTAAKSSSRCCTARTSPTARASRAAC